MADIKDYKCTYDNAVGISPEVTRKLNLVFPDTYLHGDTMVMLAKVIREHEGANFCTLPFDHALEAEAMGGIVNYGDEKAGPRAKEYLTAKTEELLQLPDMDFTKGRIKEVLNACKMLKSQGEPLVAEVQGPFTIMNILVDPKYVFKTMRKDPDQMKQVYWKFGDQLLRYIEELTQAGVDIISYADAAGGLNILGPKMAERVVEDFTYEFIKKMEAQVQKRSIITLCPKTTFALLGTNHAHLEDYPVPSGLRYGEGCLEARGKIGIVGQTCIKNVGYPLDRGIIKEVVLQ